MPHAYHIFSHKGFYQIKAPTNRAHFNLPKDKVVLCNHASALRLEPVVYEVWMKILKACDESVLVLKYFNDDRVFNTEEIARSYGIHVTYPGDRENRLFYMNNAPEQEHIPQKAMCDIYLDV